MCDGKDLLKMYQAEIRRYKPLDRDAERALIAKYKESGDVETRNAIITANLKYAFTIASKYAGGDIQLEDLIGECVFGLTKALDKFDMNKNVKFYCYAVWWVRQTIREYIDSVREIEYSHPMGDYGSDVGDDGNENGCDGESTDDIFSEWKEGYVDMIGDEDFEWSDICCNKMKGEESVKSLLETLDETERKVVDMYFGMEDEKVMTLTEIGDKMGVSRERIRQIKIKAIRKMKSEFLSRALE